VARNPLVPAFVGEAAGTFLLVFLVTMMVVFNAGILAVWVALGYGLAVAAIGTALIGVSGGHLNPAVTLAAILAKAIPAARGGAMVAGQVVGAFLGVAVARFVRASLPENLAPIFPPGLPPGDVGMAWLVLEAVFGFLVALTVLGTLHDGRFAGRLGHLPYGLASAAVLLASMPLTGSSNPARWLGQYVLRTFIPANEYSVAANATAFVIGPLLGALAAGLLWRSIPREA
jgi:aquaporin Z